MVDSRVRGFTLIELLIVIAIIGILASVLIPNLLNARNAAQARALQAHSRNVQTVALAWLSHDSTRTPGEAVTAWSPCLVSRANAGYGFSAAPGSASECTVAESVLDGVDVTVVGLVGGATVTYVNGDLP